MPQPSVLPCYITTQEICSLGITRSENNNTHSSEQETEDFNNDQMDLGWNSDFETTLLNCWGDNTEMNLQLSDEDDDNNRKTEETNNNGHQQSFSRSPPRENREEHNWGNYNLNQETLSPLTCFNMDYEVAPSEKSKSNDSGKKRYKATNSDSDSGDQESQNPASTSSGSSSRRGRRRPQHGTANVSGVTPTIPSGRAAAVSFTASVSSAKDTVSTASSSSSPFSSSQQHKQGCSSSSTSSFGIGSCRRSRNGTNEKTTNSTEPRLHPLAMQSSANCPSHGADKPKVLAPMPMNRGLHHQQGVYPVNVTDNVMHDRTAASYVASLASLQQVHQQAMMTPPNKFAAPTQVATFNHQQNASHKPNFVQPASPAPVLQQHHEQALHASVTTSHEQKQPASSTASSTPKKSRSRRKGKQQPSANNPPPFYLFDAPIELRSNFMKSQRDLGIPVMNDCNSYHYGETVKGFHPQGINVTNRDVNNPFTVPVQLIDARHGGNRAGAGRVKNEREQKRAQKITELIDQLRVNMENGGWKVEMRSKFHTLSSCADYAKHLIKTMKEKEEVVHKLKADLEVKQVEADKALQESRSDPGSVTSSLTSATFPSGKGHRSSGNGKKSDSNSKKRKQQGSSRNHASGGTSKNHRTSTSRNTSFDSTGEENYGGEDRVSCGPSTQSSSVDKTISSVSDITDSNRGSSSNSGSSGSSSEDRTEQAGRASAEDYEDGIIDKQQPLSSTIPLGAAVSSGGGGHGDVVFDNDKKSKRKRPPTEVTSLERSFELDYEEVFDKSNIPQMIAATSGKILSWNECFLKATGLKKQDVERMTIFSLVRPEKLSSFFEIVAAALRTDAEEDCKGAGSGTSGITNGDGEKEGNTPSGGGSKSSGSNERPWDYAAITLPCIDFPTMKKRQASEPTKHTDPLFVTVTLMADEDPKKRCFHCVFTDCPGTNGALGSITPELLAVLFTTPEPKRKKSKSSRKHKRARTHHKITQVREDASEVAHHQEKGPGAQEEEEEDDDFYLELMKDTENPLDL
jgi:hypothetical protein